MEMQQHRWVFIFIPNNSDAPRMTSNIASEDLAMHMADVYRKRKNGTVIAVCRTEDLASLAKKEVKRDEIIDGEIHLYNGEIVSLEEYTDRIMDPLIKAQDSKRTKTAQINVYMTEVEAIKAEIEVVKALSEARMLGGKSLASAEDSFLAIKSDLQALVLNLKQLTLS